MLANAAERTNQPLALIAMGAKDSSRTRVAPFFTRLLMRDPSGVSWLPKLLKLPEPSTGSVDVRGATVPLRTCAWWPAERQLPAPAKLLEWLVDNLPDDVALEGDERQRLRAGDGGTRKTALERLRARASDDITRAWYVFEGPTSVDAYLETEDLVVLVEGKRTESGPTTHTTYMPVRHQMLRNIDAAWDGRGDRDVAAFFIVEGAAGGAVSPEWQQHAETTISRGALEESLPHRSADERSAIAASFLGVTTWQIVCREFGIDPAALPDELSVSY